MKITLEDLIKLAELRSKSTYQYGEIMNDLKIVIKDLKKLRV